MFLCSTSETPAAWYTRVSELMVIGAARPGIWNVRTVVPEAMRLRTRWRCRAAAAWWRAITSSTRRLRSPVTSTSEAKRSASAPLQPAMRRMNGASGSPGSSVVRSARREDGTTATDRIGACGVTTAIASSVRGWRNTALVQAETRSGVAVSASQAMRTSGSGLRPEGRRSRRPAIARTRPASVAGASTRSPAATLVAARSPVIVGGPA